MDFMSYKQALQLCNDPRAGLAIISGEQLISLPPKYLDCIGQGVKEQLDEMKGFYSERLLGALIAYSNIKILGDKGILLDDSPYIHLKIQADFIVFQPRVGSRLRGCVNKTSKAHVGILVHNFFNASVAHDQDGHVEETVSKDEDCEFTVTELFLHRNHLSLRGKNIQR
ncbi:hypothetical protein C0Q70_04664 [Pomacea canaliculata]|uniref:DNA-directed RNA polymerase I subunit RPA43 n=2 Tax=Pomacea canaliculata TaxID=400727 RepID=A0A2T7PJ08_POMCA|nr:hypothetical protein C0Q70_04664 [Pomacea canaliculata]